MANNLDLGKGNIGRLLMEFSVPAIIGVVVSALYNIISRIFVGQGVGFVGIAAVTVAQPVMTLLMAVAMLIGIGATAMISIRLGQQRQEEAEKIIGNATLLFITFPLVLTVIYFLFPVPILKLFGASAEVLPHAHDYLSLIMLASVPGSIGFGMNNFIRAEGNPRIAMLTQIIGAVINIILNYVFVLKMGLGVKGAALAAVIGQTVSAIWVLSYYLTGRSKLKLRASALKPDLSIISGTFIIGFAPFAMQIANTIQQTIMNKTLFFYGGDLALAAVGIVMSIGMLVLMPIVGISQGAQPIIGFNYGAKSQDRVWKTLKIAIIYGTILATLGFIVIRLFATPIVALFSKGDVALTELSVHALLTFFAILPIVGFQIIGANYFQAVGKAVQSTILSLSRQVLLFIPLLIILPRFMGIEGAWITAPIADVLSVMITASFLYYELRKQAKQKSEVATKAS